MFKIKQLPEDFIVTEQSSVQLSDKKGAYSLCRLIKTNISAADCMDILAKKLNLKLKDVGFAGTKDKLAVTSQLVSLKHVSQQTIRSFTADNCSLEFLGFSSKPINLGDLEGNRFKIIVRNLDSADIHSVPDSFAVPNYFDEQRFSSANIEIGAAILKNDLKKAAALIQDSMKTNKRAAILKSHLEESPNDFANAIKLAVPKKVMLFYIHSVQSYIFNRSLAAAVGKYFPKTKSVEYSRGNFIFPDTSVPESLLSLEAPIIGFGSEINSDDSEFMSAFNKESSTVLSEFGITQRSFIIRSIPDISSEGSARKVFVKPENITVSPPETDGLNPGKKKCTLEFFLPKASYATIVIKALFG